MKKLVTLFVALLISGLSFGQITVSGSVGADGAYTSLTNAAGAFLAINGTAQTGADIVIDIIGDVTTEAGTNSLNAGEWTTLTIKPSGGAARTISGTVAGAPMINFNGADNVTIDGLNTGGNALTISNLSTAATTNTSTIRFIADATNNTITNCSILGSAKVPLTTIGGNIFISTGTSSGNDNITISNCKIGPAGTNLPSKGIYGNGSQTNANITNSNVTINNCEIYDFFLAGGCAGVYALTGNTDWNITNNKIYQTAPRAMTSTMSGIYFSNATYGNNIQITGNTIGYASNAATGTLTQTGTGSFYGIFLYAMTTAANACNINNNVVSDISLTSTTGAFYGIYNATEASSNTININGNQIKNIGLITTTGSCYGINWTSATNMIITGNNVHDITRSGAGIIYGIYSGSSSVNETVSNNNVYNLSCTHATTASSIYGIHQLTSTGTKVFQFNNIYNLSGSYGNTIHGISVSNGTAVDISSNNIHDLTATGGTAGTIYGINLGSTATVMNVYKNKIYSIGSSSAGPAVYGITIAGGTTRNIYNNMIGGLTAPAASGADVIRGINITSSTSLSNVNVYYNTIYINASSTGTNFGSSGIFHAANLTATTAALDMRNNIIVNTSTANGTGRTVAFRRSSAALDNYAATSNNNLLYAGIPGASNLIMSGGSTYQTLANFQTAVGPRDAMSVTENPPFISTSNLHLTGGVSTLCESGGIYVAGITDDYDGDVRQGNSGYTGTGFFSDIGADEFEGSNPSLSALDMGAIALVSPAAIGCYTSTEAVVVTIKNYGTAVINFVSNPVSVTTQVSGAVTQTLSNIVNSGTLAPGASQNVTMPTILDMSAAGTYTFNASTSVADDGNAANNAIIPVTRIVAPTADMPQTVDFTGFTVNNLTYLFPNWHEANGESLPSGTNSDWSDQSGWTPANTSASVMLENNYRREWIVGPKVVVTASTVLTYKIAITAPQAVTPHATGMQGTDDRVVVKISTDCGTSFTDLFTHDASNTASVSNVFVGQHINLAAYDGQQIIIAFFATEGIINDISSYDFHIDDISIRDTIPCHAPTAQTATNITTVGADLGWTSPASFFDIFISTAATPVPNGSSVPTVNNVSGNSYSWMGGTVNNTYYWWVRADCDAAGGTGQSLWVGPYSFFIPCSPISSFPYAENFNSITPPALPICYSAIDANADGDKWKTFTGFGVESTICAGIYTDYNNGDNDDYLILPQFTLTGEQTLKFSVRARSASEPNDYRVVLSTTNDNPASFTTVLMPLTTVSSETMTEIALIDLAAYVGNVWIAIHVPSGGLDGYYLYVDDIFVGLDVVPVITNLSSDSGCEGSSLVINGAKLNNATSVTIGGTVATISSITAASITVTIGAGTTGKVAVITPYDTVTSVAVFTVNLLPSLVTATASSNTICEGTSIDLFSSATSNAANSLNYTEGFETWPPAGWTFLNAGSGNAWGLGTQAYPGGSQSMSYHYHATNPANAWGFTKPITLDAGISYTITFWYLTGAYNEKLKVTVGSDATVVAQATTLWNNNGGTSLSNTVWAQATTTYTPSTSGTYYFGFNCYSDADKNVLFVDDISITGSSPLIPPTYSWVSAPAGYTSTDQNPTGIIPTVTTEYIVTAENFYGCTATASTTVIVDPCTGIQENDGSITVSVVPNPSNGLFYISVAGISETVTLNIYSVTGQVIYSEQFDNSGLSNKPIDLKSYPKGMYFLRLTNNNMTHTEKIIIE